MKIELPWTYHKKTNPAHSNMPALKTISKSLCKFTVPIDSTIKSFKVKANGSLKLHHCLIDIEVQYGRIIATKYGKLILDHDIQAFVPTSGKTSERNARYVSSPKDSKITLDATKHDHCKIIINQHELPEMKISIGPNVIVKTFCSNLQVIVNDQLAAECLLYNNIDDIVMNALADNALEETIDASDNKNRLLGKWTHDFNVHGFIFNADDKHLVHYSTDTKKDIVLGSFARIMEALYIVDDNYQRFIQVYYFDSEDVSGIATYFFDMAKKEYVPADNKLPDNYDYYNIPKYYRTEVATGHHIYFEDNPYIRDSHE